MTEERPCRVCRAKKLWPDEFRSDKGSFTRCKECAREYQRNWNNANRALCRKWQTDFRRARKKRVIGHYGGACECCGEDDLRFLTIDHIDGDGARHRILIGRKSGVHFHWWLEKNDYPDGYRVLCFNCNVASYWNGGVCPHKEGTE